MIDLFAIAVSHGLLLLCVLRLLQRDALDAAPSEAEPGAAAPHSIAPSLVPTLAARRGGHDA